MPKQIMALILPLRLSKWWLVFFGKRQEISVPSRAPSEDLPHTPAEPGLAPLSAVVPAVLAPPAIDRVEAANSVCPAGSTPATGIERERVPVNAERRACTLGELSKLKQIPALQSIARGFQQATSREEGSLDEVVELVRKDPALCVRVLRMANSAFFASDQPIDDIMTAVHMLGLRRVRTLTTALFTMRDTNAVTAGFDWKHLWVHGLATASVAEELEHLLGLRPHPQLYLAALMHDVGKIVLATIEPEVYRKVLVDSWQGSCRLEELEQTHLGVGHGEAGEIFARENSLPAEVVEAIAHHARPEVATHSPLVVALVNIANYVSKSYGLGFSGARLDDVDGDFETLPAWTVIAAQIGAVGDLGQLEEEMRDYVHRLKPELQIVCKDL